MRRQLVFLILGFAATLARAEDTQIIGIPGGGHEVLHLDFECASAFGLYPVPDANGRVAQYIAPSGQVTDWGCWSHGADGQITIIWGRGGNTPASTPVAAPVDMPTRSPAQTYVPPAPVSVDEQARNQHEPVIQAKLDNYWGPIARKSPLAYSAQTGAFGNDDIKFTTVACNIGEKSGNLAVAFSNYGAHVGKVGCWHDAADGVHVTWVAANGKSELLVAPYDKLIKLQ